MRLASIGLPTLDIPSTPSGPEGSSGSGLNRCWGQAGGGLFSGLRHQARTNRTRQRRGGRAVECTGLEKRQGVTPFEGSNHSHSATHPPAPCPSDQPAVPVALLSTAAHGKKATHRSAARSARQKLLLVRGQLCLSSLPDAFTPYKTPPSQITPCGRI